MASVCHALGRGAARCRAGARRRWSGGVRVPGSGGRGLRALGGSRCLRERGGGAAVSRPCIAGFRSVGVGVCTAVARVESGWGGVVARGVVGGFGHRRGDARGCRRGCRGGLRAGGVELTCWSDCLQCVCACGCVCVVACM